MRHSQRRWTWFVLLATAITGSTPAGSGAQAREAWDVTQARGRTRDIDFTTSEGTWMSLDLAPDGQWVVFDLLAHVYRVPVGGGTAESLTQNSGVALNFQPRISPDGRHIAFVSDRRGQNNLWIMNADGSNPRPVFVNDNVRVAEPAWSADGQYIFVRRQGMGAPGEGGGAGGGIWMYHRDGGEGIEVIGASSGLSGPAWPSPSRDGRYLYFQVNAGSARDVVRGSVQLRRFEFATREVIAITSGEANTQIRLSSGGAFAPEVSPDGRWLAFARRIPNARISYKGHEYGPRTALWLRNLETGAERLAMDPVEIDMSEGGGSRALPGYAWSRDGRSLVVAQGGKIRRVDVTTGEVATIPFTARVRRTISEMAAATFRQNDDTFEAKFLRWHTMSPDRRKLAFQAIGRVWVMDLPGGTPRRLTPSTFEPFEFAPAWSPDGQWLAFTTVDDTGRGHVWKARVGVGRQGPTPARGGRGPAPDLVRLTNVAAEYVHPVWSPDGKEVIAVRGSGATFRGQAMMFNPWYDLVRVPETGGAATNIIRVARASEGDIYSFARRSIVQPAFGPEGRLYYLEERQPPGTGAARGRPVMYFNSVRLDGTDRRSHLRFPFADEAVPSPDGQWVAFQEGDNIYLTSLAAGGTGDEPLLVEKRRGRVPVRQVSTTGGLFPRWLDATTLEYGSANRHFVYRVGERTTDTTAIRLSVERYKPTGTLALTGARIITLDNRRVVESGTVVVRGSRITCAGDCPTSGVDRTIDVSGTTIMPGLIDMHAHHHREHRGFRPRHDFEVGVYLAFGVTTNLDNSMWSQNIFPTAELIEAGETPGPRTFSTGDPLYRGDAPRQNELTTYDVAEQNVQRLASWGAVSLKQYQQPRRDQRQWVSHAARKLGLRVTGEGGDLEYDLSMIMDGQTGWEHPLDNLPLYGDVTRFLGEAKATYSVTFGVGSAVWNEEYWWAESEVWKNPRLQKWLPWRTLLPHSRRVMQRPATDYNYPILAQAVADIIAAGGNGAIGSHGQAHGIAPHWEVWMASSALGNHGALELGSLGGARFLGMESDLGSLANDKLADLVVLNGNPLEDIRQTANIRYVMRGGVLYESETLDEIWPRKRPFGVHPWFDPVSLQTDVKGTDHHDKAMKTNQESRPKP
jgi:Tol biopolymer transport system component